jgi:hypothetical protein
LNLLVNLPDGLHQRCPEQGHISIYVPYLFYVVNCPRLVWELSRLVSGNTHLTRGIYRDRTFEVHVLVSKPARILENIKS